MRRIAILSFFLFILTAFGLSLSADVAGQNAPTLVPPTLVPTVDAGISDALPSESAIARVMRDGRVRVGLLYNRPPFGELNIRGEVSGYDADLARSMAEAWGVEFEPVQVTQQTALAMVKNGSVDMLLAAQVHRRELAFDVEFSETYFGGSQSILVREGDGAASPADMANRKIGVVLGTAAEGAVAEWQARTGITFSVQTYVTLDKAFSALVNSEVDGVVDSRVALTRIVPAPGIARIVEQGISPEPYAIVVRRQDVNWRNLINRTLQFLTRSGRMEEIHRAHFPGTPFSPDLIPVWAGLGEEAPKLAQFGGDIPYPAQYAVPRIQNAGVVRVAGFADLPADAPEGDRRLDALNRGMMEAVAARWGVRVEYIPNSRDNAIDLVAGGQADMAVGVRLDWSMTDRVDLTAPYLIHGDRLMVKSNDQIETFNNLRGQTIGLFASDTGAAERAEAIADSINTRISTFTILREEDAILQVFENSNADVLFGDSLKLIPLLEANPDLVRITTRGDSADPWYSRNYIGMAVPRNDLDFRLLVEYTLQELARDGTWQGMLGGVMLPDDVPPFEIWPGSSSFLGIALDRSNLLGG